MLDLDRELELTDCNDGAFLATAADRILDPSAAVAHRRAVRLPTDDPAAAAANRSAVAAVIAMADGAECVDMGGSGGGEGGDVCDLLLRMHRLYMRRCTMRVRRVRVRAQTATAAAFAAAARSPREGTADARWLAHALLCRAPWFHAGGGGPAAAALCQWSGGGGGGGVAARAARLQRAAERAGPAAFPFRAESSGRADWDALVAGGAGPALLAACLEAELDPAGTGDAGGGGGRAAAGTGAGAALAGGGAAAEHAA